MRTILALLLMLSPAFAQDGHHGHDHEQWHGDFYSTLRRADGFMCCNKNDCRPTQSRTSGDHYEVMVNGEWVAVETNKIVRVPAPDGAAHVCAPVQTGAFKGVIFCVVLPAET